jgi:hypothetical protein
MNDDALAEFLKEVMALAQARGVRTLVVGAVSEDGHTFRMTHFGSHLESEGLATRLHEQVAMAARGLVQVTQHPVQAPAPEPNKPNNTSGMN